MVQVGGSLGAARPLPSKEQGKTGGFSIHLQKQLS